MADGPALVHEEPPHEVRAIGAPARRALTSAGLTTRGAVGAASDHDLLALHGFGPRALTILRRGPSELHE